MGIWGRTGQDVTACGWVRRSRIEAQKCVSGQHPQTSRKHTLKICQPESIGKAASVDQRGREERVGCKKVKNDCVHLVL